MKRILVTGGAGFIGSHLCERLLADGNHVIVIDNLFTGRRANLPNHPELDFVYGDVCQPIWAVFDEAYHLACPASPVHYQRNPVETIRTGVIGTLQVLEAAHRNRARVLLASTSEVYGDPQIHPQPEDYTGNVNTISPRACYDESKRCGEALATSYTMQYGLDVRIARIFNTFGCRMANNDGRVIPAFITAALRSEPLPIQGTGEQTRSFCYVDDTVEALVRMMSMATLYETALWNRVPYPLNIGNDHEITINELATMILRMTGHRSNINYLPAAVDDPRKRRPDLRRTKEVLNGWAPRWSIEDGITRTIAYFQRLIVREPSL